MKNILIILIVFFLFSTIGAQSVNVVLKNNKVVIGNIINEEANHLIIINDMGEIKLNRKNIVSITYNNQLTEPEKVDDNAEITENSIKPSNTEMNKIVLNDIVLVYFKNGDIISGTLLAKSLDVILVKTESGSLTIPKREIQKIEYLSGEFSERGEVVVAHLANGNKFEGNIYFEDYQNLILDTRVGRLTIDKSNLHSIEYLDKGDTVDDSLEEELINNEYIALEKDEGQKISQTTNRRFVEPRLDVFSLGYSPSFGTDYSTGLGIGYSSKFLISHMDGFYISAIGGLELNYFALNSDEFANESFPVSASGGVFLTTISAGASFTLFQKTNSKYELYIAPQLETNILYKNLTKDFPSFPSLNSKVSETSFIFGIGNKIGLDILLDNMKIGISYDLHFLFGDEDYNMISINFSKKLF